jgi:chromosome condensin MukBEF MukE localization factor
MFFYLTAQHTTRIVRLVMQHMFTITGEILAVLLIFALGALLLAF